MNLTGSKSNEKGFTVVELLVVITIIIILAVVVVLILNPLEITRRKHDADRVADLGSLQLAITNSLSNATDSAAMVLCNNATPPCSGNSNDPNPNVRKQDGTGWVKVNLSTKNPMLPVDPINNAQYHYTYSTNNTSEVWEIDAVLESDQQKGRMKTDGGNNDSQFEVGSDLTILP